MTTETLARAYFYMKLGWANYLAWWLGAITYITIIYELVLKALLPATPITYILMNKALAAGLQAQLKEMLNKAVR